LNGTHRTLLGISVLSCLAATAVGCGESGSATSATALGEPPAPTSASIADSSSARTTGGAGAGTGAFPFETILCFGDSITYGVTLQAPLPGGASGALALTEGYVPKLWRLLQAKYGSGLMLVNDGIGGETSDEGLDRFQDEIHLYHPDLVLLLEGVVDVNNTDPRFTAVRDNLAEMMRIAHREGTPIIIGTYPLLNPDGFRTSGASNVSRLNEIIRSEAGKQAVPVADHEKAFGDTSGQGPDGLHPNNFGYEVMAGVWFASIEALSAAMTGT
jgi:lysophospholipase L1-like esterase